MLRVDGEVHRPRDFGFADLASLPEQVEDVGTLAPGRQGGAVKLTALLEAVGVSTAASHVTLESTDGKFSQQAPIGGVRSALVIYRICEAPLPASEGGPIRFLIPNLEECGV